MTIDIHFYSQDLLQKLANAIYDRNQAGAPLFCFTTAELHIVEKWLKELLVDKEKAWNNPA